MERMYSATLYFNPNKLLDKNISFKEYDEFIDKLKDYLLSLRLFKQDPRLPFIKVSSRLYVVTEDEQSLIGIHPGSEFMLSSIRVEPKRCLEELEAIKYALTVAKQLESANPQFDPKLKFDPNSIRLFVGEDSEGNFIPYNEFIPNAIRLQRALYGGGTIFYGESSGHFSLRFGIEDKIRNSFHFGGIINAGGVAKSASSLDELLERINAAQ